MIVGGATFGAGRILERRCSSRLLVPAVRSNVRSVVTGLVFAMTTQASWTGLLLPWLRAIAGQWTVKGSAARDLTSIRCRYGPLASTRTSAEVLTRVQFGSDRVTTFDFGLMPSVVLGTFGELR